MNKKIFLTNLVCFDIFHSEVEPDSEPGVACVWSDEQVILILCDVVHSTQIAYNIAIF